MDVNSMSQRPFAVFDVDGTVIRWQLYHAVVDALVKAGHINATEFQKVREARMNWKRRTTTTSFSDYEHALVDIYDAFITQISYEDYMSCITSVFDEYKEQTYTYTRGLIKSLKEQNYLLFAISASQQEIVGLLAKYYGFDDYGGSTYEIVDGRFTGQKFALKRDKKPLLLEQLVRKHNATWQGSIAIGDSDSDIPLLSAVEKPIAFNPNRSFFEHAKSNNWTVVLERKNMVYTLESRDGTYVLA